MEDHDRQTSFEEMDESGVPPPVEVLQKEPTSKRKEAERLRTLQQLLGNLQQGWKISVYRSSPNWCRGHLETFECYDVNEPLDIDYLAKRWGGQALQLKIHDEGGRWVGGGTVPLYSYEPRRRGEIITENQLLGYGQPTSTASPAPLPNQTFDLKQQQAGFLGSLGMSVPELLKMMQTSSKSENAVMLKLLERQLAAPPVVQATAPAPIPAQQTPFKMFKEMMEMQAMMREMAQTYGGDGGGGDAGGGMDGILGTLAQSFLNRPPQAPTTPRPRQRRRARIMAPPNSTPPTPPTPPTQQPIQNSQTQQFVNNAEPPPLNKLSDQLAFLSPDDSSDVVIEAFGKMPEDKRARAMQAFIQKAQGGQLDDSSYIDETYSQDDDPEYFDEEIPSQEHTPPDSGGTTPTDARDGAPDRDCDPQR